MSYILGTSGQTSYVQCDNIDCWVFKRGYKQNFSYMYENNLRIPFLKIKYTETFQDFCYYIGILDLLRVGQYWQSTFFVIDIFENINFLTLVEAGGRGDQSVPLVRRLAPISHRIILWSQKFLTLSINIPTRRW